MESNQFSSYPTLEQDQVEKDDLNKKVQVVKMSTITVEGIKYSFNKDTGEVFDFESVQRAKKTGEEYLYIGRLVQDGPRRFHIDKTMLRF